jgi:hypothetical protein
VLVAALGLHVRPAAVAAASAGRCRAAGTPVPVLPGAAVVVRGGAGPVAVRRFAAGTTVPVGSALATPVVLRFPRDNAPTRPWLVTAAGPRARICALS